MAFEDWLAEQLRARSWREADLGAAVGVSQQTASRWLNGRSQPSRLHVASLAAALEVSVEEVLRRCRPNDAALEPRQSDAAALSER